MEFSNKLNARILNRLTALLLTVIICFGLLPSLPIAQASTSVTERLSDGLPKTITIELDNYETNGLIYNSGGNSVCQYMGGSDADGYKVYCYCLNHGLKANSTVTSFTLNENETYSNNRVLANVYFAGYNDPTRTSTGTDGYIATLGSNIYTILNDVVSALPYTTKSGVQWSNVKEDEFRRATGIAIWMATSSGTYAHQVGIENSYTFASGSAQLIARGDCGDWIPISSNGGQITILNVARDLYAYASYLANVMNFSFADRTTGIIDMPVAQTETWKNSKSDNFLNYWVGETQILDFSKAEADGSGNIEKAYENFGGEGNLDNPIRKQEINGKEYYVIYWLTVSNTQFADEASNNAPMHVNLTTEGDMPEGTILRKLTSEDITYLGLSESELKGDHGTGIFYELGEGSRGTEEQVHLMLYQNGSIESGTNYIDSYIGTTQIDFVKKSTYKGAFATYYKICVPVDSVSEGTGAKFGVKSNGSVLQYKMLVAQPSKSGYQSFLLASNLDTVSSYSTILWGTSSISSNDELLKVDDSGNPLAGAEFTFTASDGTVYGPWTTDSDGKITYQWTDSSDEHYLPPDTYTVAETKGLDGYELDTSTKTITLSSDGTATGDTLKFVNKKVEISPVTTILESTLLKVDQKGNPVEGCVFNFLGLTTGVNRDFITDTDGHIDIQWTDSSNTANYVPPGTYTVTETSAPETYYPDDTVRQIVLNADGTCSGQLVFVNEKKVTIYLEKIDGDTNEYLSGVYFDVWKDGDYVGQVGPTDAGIIEVSSINGEGLSPGYYEFQETAAPDGYILSTEKKGINIDYDTYSDINSMQGVELVFRNYKLPQINIKKNSTGTNTSLSGATFKVYVNGEDLGGTYTTDSSGEIQISEDEYKSHLDTSKSSWTVRVEEITPPDGYTLSDPNWQEQTVSAGGTAVFTFDDNKIPSIVIKKIDATTNQPLAGATFSITIDGQEFGSKTTDSEGIIEITPEEYGDYIGNTAEWTVGVQETEAPAGYQIVDGNWHYQTMQAGMLEARFEFKDYKDTTITVLKKAAGTTTGLPGAVFEVAIDGQTVGDGFTTGDDGLFTIDYETYGEFLDPDKDSWTLTVTEITPPAGYMLSDPVSQTVEIKLGQALSTLTFEDEPYTTIEIEKQSADTGENLDGAKFDVYIDGTKIGEFETENGGKISISYENFKDYLNDSKDEWTVKVVETQAPDGYLINEPSEHTAILKKGQTLLTFTFNDSKYPKIRIVKLSAGTNIGLDGARFEVYIDGKKIENYVTDANGEIVIDHDHYAEFLDPSKDSWTVTVVETTAPDGYLLNDPNWQEQELSLGEELATFTFVDDEYPKIKIRKTIAGTTTGLQGARFEVRIDDQSLGEFTTNEDGWIEIGYYDTCDENGNILYPGYGNFLDTNQESWVISTRETEPPRGYLIDDPEWHSLTMYKGQDLATFEFEDTSIIKLKIRKISAGTNEGLSGAKFKVTIDGVDVGEYITDEDGYIQLSYFDTYDDDGNLLYKGYGEFLNITKDSWTVTVTELEAPKGYLLNTPNYQSQEMHAGKELAEFVFLDDEYPKIKIQKVIAGTNTGLQGARFAVKIDENILGEFTTDKNGYIEIGYFDTYDEDGNLLYQGYGKFLSTDQESWVVSVQETEAPKGYIISDPEWHNVTMYKGEDLATFVFEDVEYPEIEIRKVSSGTNIGLPGAKFEVTIDGVKLDEYLTDDSGTIKIKYFDTYDEDGNLLYKGYGEFLTQGKDSWTITATEIEPPEGYLLNTPNYKTQELHLEKKLATFVFEDDKYPDIEILKLISGTETGLPGAVFEVKIDEEILGKFKTDKDGRIVIGYFDACDEDGNVLLDEDGKVLYPGYGKFLNTEEETWIVAVREVSPPDGYMIIDPDWHSQELKKGQDLTTFVFEDEEYPDIEIMKIDRETGEPLANASFKVEIDGQIVFDEISTDENGLIKIGYYDTLDEDGNVIYPGYRRFLNEDYQDGWTITVTELEPPDNYNKDKQLTSGDYTQTQQLKFGQKLTTFEFKDTSYRDIKVYKKDAETGWLLAGAEFTLHCVSADDPLTGSNVSDRVLTTDASGYVIFEDVPNGTYELTETRAPTGYQLIEEVKTIVVTSSSDPVIEFTFKDAPTSGLMIYKVDSTTKQPIANVSFRITPLSPLTDAPWTGITNENGVYVKEGLPYGSYQIEEIATADGYILSNEVKVLTIGNQHDAYTVTFENNQKSMVNILKLDAITQEPLAGAMFTIKKASGEFVATVTTGSNGYASLTGLEPGNYVVTEIDSPEGYIIDQTPQTFEITESDSGKVITLIFNNQPTPNLYLKKVDANTHVGLEGAVFKIWRSDGTVVADSATTDSAGFIHIENLTEGTYQIQETKAPDGYTLDSTVTTVYLEAGQTKTITLENSQPGGIAIHKIDSLTKESLAGATFELRTLDGTVIGQRVTTGSDGYARWDDIEPGWYEIYEISAPDGYILSTEPIKVEVTAFNSAEIEWENDKNSTLTIIKRDSATGLPLANAEFEILTEDFELVTTLTTDENGTITSGYIEPGDYFIHETKAPAGYVLDTTDYQIVEIKENEPITIEIENTPYSLIVVSKVDGETKQPLEGAVIEIRTLSGNLIGSYTTDASGVITSPELQPDRYYIIETKAPDGYVLSSEKIQIALNAGIEYPVTIENFKESVLKVYKYDSASGNPLAGAEFEILTEDYETIGFVTTDSSGYGYMQDLTPGDYILREVTAPDGYAIDSQEYRFTVEIGKDVTIDVPNSSKPSLTISKIDSVSGEAVAGAVFEIWYDDGTDEGNYVGKYETDELGMISTEGLVPGYYLIKEVSAPDGYVLDETIHRFYVSSDSENILTIENVPLPSLRIKKIDSKTGEPIAGVQFKVEDGDTFDLIGMYETDANGEILITGLNPGLYLVTETAAPEGYTVDPNPALVEVEEGKNAFVDVVNHPDGSLEIILSDAYTDEYLPDGHFVVTSEEDQVVVCDASTDADGIISVGELSPGFYKVEQVSPPPGYTMIDTVKTVEVLPGELQIVYFEDATSGLVIEDVDAEYPTLMLEGGRFKVVNNEDNSVLGEYVTGKDGLALIDGIEPGLYTVTQLVPPEGYSLNTEEQLVHVKEGTVAHVTFLNSPLSSITVNVVDKATQQGIAGAIVEIWHQNGEFYNSYTSDTTGLIQTTKLPAGYYVLKLTYIPDGYTAEITEATVQVQDGLETTYKFELISKGNLKILSVDGSNSALSGMKATVTTLDGTIIGNYITGTDGSVIVDNLEPGWYQVTETEAPEGYSIVSDPVQQVEVPSSGQAVVTFIHDKNYGLQIITSEKTTGTKIPGAVYSITKRNGEIIGTYTSDDAGLIAVNLTPDWYVITPVSVPSGYTMESTEARTVEVKAGELTTTEFFVIQMASMRVKVVDGSTDKALYNVRLQLKAADGTCAKEYYTDADGYIEIESSLVAGDYTLEMISAPDGYIVDTIPKSLSVLMGETTEATWALYTEGGQIQVVVTSAARNTIVNKAAGTKLSGAVIQITNADTYQVVGQMISGSNGVASSAALPIGRYTLKMITAPEYYTINSSWNPEVRIKVNNDVQRTTVTVDNIVLSNNITLKSNDTIRAGNTMRVDITSAKSGSNARLDNFFLHIKFPTDAVRAVTLSTGTWNKSVNYSITYATNMNGYRTLVSNLNSKSNYAYGIGTEDLGLQSGEYVTDIRFEFGTVPSGFETTTAPCYTQYVLATVYNGYQIISRVEMGGQYNTVSVNTATTDNNNPYSTSGSIVVVGNNGGAYGGTGSVATSGNSGQWTTGTSLWTTTVVNPTVATPTTLPKTGY